MIRDRVTGNHDEVRFLGAQRREQGPLPPAQALTVQISDVSEDHTLSNSRHDPVPGHLEPVGLDEERVDGEEPESGKG